MKFKLLDIWYFIQGNIRYFLYYYKSNYFFSNKKIRWIFLLPLHKLIPLHIREQIEYRINSMNQDCYRSGSCIKCGCKTTNLQMANKSCEGYCYPAMQSRKNWNLLKNNKIIISEKRAWKLRQRTFSKFEIGDEVEE